MAINFKQIISSGLARGKSYDEIRKKLAETSNLSSESMTELDLVMGKEKETPESQALVGQRKTQVESGRNLSNQIREYKALIDEHGFSSSFLSPEVAGKARAMRGNILTSVKQAETLGTLDKGLLEFATEIIGQVPEFDGTNLNLLGRKSKYISSQLDTLAVQTDEKVKIQEEALGIKGETPTRSEVMDKFNKLYAFAQENPEDARSKKFMDDWNNDRFDLVSGQIKKEFKELTPFERKEQERNKLAGFVDTGEEDPGIVDRVVKGETGLINNLADNFMSLKNNLVQTSTDVASSFNEMKDASGKAIQALKDGDMEGYKLEIDRAKANTQLASLEGLVGITGTLGKFIGDLGMTGLEAADDTTKNIVSSSFNGAVKTVIDELNQTEQGRAGLEALQGKVEDWNAWAEANPDTAKDIGNVMGILEGATTILGVGALKKGVLATGEATLNAIQKAGSATGEVFSGTKNIAEGAISKTGQAIMHPLKTAEEAISSTHKAVIDRRLKNAGDVPEEISKAATKSGFDESQSAFLSTMQPADKEVAIKLIDLAEQASTDKRIIQRPTDIVGQNLVRKQKPLEDLGRKFGQEVDLASKSLRGKTVDTTPLVSKIDSVLDNLNIKRTDDGFNFDESVFKNIPEIQKKLVTAFSDIENLNNDAYQAHIFKKSIDEIVNFGTAGEGLKGSAATTLKSLRHDVDALLDGSFPDYKVANDKFKEIKEVLEQSGDLFGKKGITEQKAGQAMRRIFSNASSRGDIMEFLEKIDTVAKKYKVETGENLLDQAIFTEILEGIYGTQATTSIQGEVTKALGVAKKAADILKDPIKGTGKAAADGIEFFSGKGAEMQKEFIKKLLKSGSK